MFNHKRLMAVAVVVALAMVFAVPSWGANFRRINDQQFFDMCKEGNTQGVIEAIKSGVNVNAKDNDGMTALMKAAVRGHTETVNALIKAGSEVNAKNEVGSTALMVAANQGQTETANALIRAGAEVNAKDNVGMTVLIWAAIMGHTETVNALIDAGVDVNAKDEWGETALMWEAIYGHTEIVNALIEAGADDLTDKNGKTALIHAASSHNSNPETVNYLIDAGSYVKQKDNNGKMALDYARENPIFKGTDTLKRLEELSR